MFLINNAQNITQVEIVMYYFSGGLNLLALIPSFALIIVSFCWEKHWNLTVQFNFQMLLMSLIHSFAYLMDFIFNKNKELCLFQSILSQYSIIVTMFILDSIFFISLSQFQTPQKFEANLNKIRICLIIFSWVLPILFVYLMNKDFYKDIVIKEWEKYYCWSESSFSLYLFPVISVLSYVFCIIMICQLQRSTKIFISKATSSDFDERYEQRLKRYSIVMWISFWLTIINIIWMFVEQNPKFYFYDIINDILTIICTIGEGITLPMFVIIFGFNTKRWNYLKSLFLCEKSKEIEQGPMFLKFSIKDVGIDEPSDD